NRPVDRMHVLYLVVRKVPEREARLDQHALQLAGAGIQDVVAGVARPAGGQDIRVRRRAELVDEFLVDRRTVGEQRDVRVLEAAAEVDGVRLGDRHAEAKRRPQRFRRVLRDREARRIEALLVGLDRPRHAVDGVVRLREGRRIGPVEAARVDADRQRVAGAEDVLLRYRRVQHDALGARIADAREQVAGRLLRHRHLDVHLVGRAGNRWRLDADIRLEIAEALHAGFRALDPRAVVPRVLDLAELAPDHLVARLRVAGDVDLAHVRAAT